MQRQTAIVSALAACALLTACGGGSVGKTLGLERQPPDEFQVLSRPPLHIPPEFNLRPPSDGSDDYGLMVPASRQAEQTVFGGGYGASTNLSSGSAETAVMPVTSDSLATGTDQNFLDLAGARSANPEIRKILRQETGQTGYEEEKSLLEKLREPSDKQPTVDALKEAERIKEVQAEGRPINDGDIQTKEPKDRGIFDKLDGIF